MFAQADSGTWLPSTSLPSSRSKPAPSLVFWTAAQLAAGLASGGERALVALREGEIAGYLCYRAVADQAELLGIAVAPRLRRGGVAKELLADLCRRLAKGGVHSLHLEVRPTNSAAIALYRRVGFVVIGRRSGYYDDGQDALLSPRALARVRLRPADALQSRTLA